MAVASVGSSIGSIIGSAVFGSIDDQIDLLKTKNMLAKSATCLFMWSNHGVEEAC